MRTSPGHRDHQISPRWIFFHWGYIKSKVYVRNYATLEDLKASITAAFQDVSREMIHATMLSFVNRLKKVVKVKGGHVEK